MIGNPRSLIRVSSCKYKMNISNRTVTGKDEKFVVLADVVDLHIRISGHYLLLRWELGALLELKVPNCSR